MRSALSLVLDRIREAPKGAVHPRTRLVEVDGYERCSADAKEWCSAAGLSPDVGALARLVASESGALPPQYMVAVAEACLNECQKKGYSPFGLITMSQVRLRGGRKAKSAGQFGRQSGRWCASTQDPSRKHIEAAKVAIEAMSAPLVAGDARRWIHPKAQDGGRQAGRPLKYDAVGIVRKWGVEGWEWIGQLYGGAELLIDPYVLMLFRFAGRGKANVDAGVAAILDGRRRWRRRAA